MNLSPDEARRALEAIETSRHAMRSVIRSHRGHLQLWLWGAIWVLMAMAAQFLGLEGVKRMPWLSAIGFVLSAAIAMSQSTRLRGALDRRFIALLAVTLVFAAVWP